MAFKIPSYVRPLKGYWSDRTYVGYQKSLQSKTCFTMGRFGFNNPYSATMFGYLFQKGYSEKTGRNCVERMEMLLDPSGKNLEKYSPNWTDLIPHKGVKITIQMAGKIMDAGGDAMMNQDLVTKGAYNSYEPGGPSYKEYVSYALLYWKNKPTHGPAYVLYRDMKGL